MLDSFVPTVQELKQYFFAIPFKSFFIRALIDNDIEAIEQIFGSHIDEYININDIALENVRAIIQHGKFKALKFLIDNLKYDFTRKLFRDGTDLLDIAITSNNIDMIKLLCSKGCFDFTNENIDSFGMNRLHRAIYANNFYAVKRLLSYNMRLAYKTDAKGRSAFHYAVICNHKELFDHLVEATDIKKRKAKKNKSVKKQDLQSFKQYYWQCIKNAVKNNQDITVISGELQPRQSWQEIMLFVNNFYKCIFGLQDPTLIPNIVARFESYFFDPKNSADISINDLCTVLDVLRNAYLLYRDEDFKLNRLHILSEMVSLQLTKHQNNEMINSDDDFIIKFCNYELSEIGSYIACYFVAMDNYSEALSYVRHISILIPYKLDIELYSLYQLGKYEQALQRIEEELEYCPKGSLLHNKLISTLLSMQDSFERDIYYENEIFEGDGLYYLYRIYYNAAPNPGNWLKISLHQIDNIINQQPFLPQKILGFLIKAWVYLKKYSKNKLAVNCANRAISLAQQFDSDQLQQIVVENVVCIYMSSDQVNKGIKFFKKMSLTYNKNDLVGIRYQQSIKACEIFLISKKNPETACDLLVSLENNHNNEVYRDILSRAYGWIMRGIIFDNKGVAASFGKYDMFIEKCKNRAFALDPSNNLVLQIYQKWYMQITHVVPQSLVREDEVFYWDIKKNVFCSSDETVYKVEISNSQQIYVTIDPKLKISEFAQECKTAIRKGFSTGKSNGLRIVHKKFIKLKMKRDLRLFTNKIYINEKRKALINLDHKTNHKGIKRCLAQSGSIEIIYTAKHVYDIMPRIALGIDINQTTENSNRILNNQIISYKKIYSQEEYQDKFGVPYNNRIILKLKTVAEYYIDKMVQTINHYINFLNNLLDIKIDAAELIESVLSQIQKLNILLSDMLENSQQSLSLPYHPPFDDFDPEEPYGGSFNQPESSKDNYHIAVLGSSNNTEIHNDTDYLL